MALTRADLINMDYIVLPMTLPDGHQGKVLGAILIDAAGNPISFSGSTPYHLPSSAASANATNIKTSAGTLNGIYAKNTNASARYLHLYDKATAPTPGTDTPVATFDIPASGTLAYEPPGGIAFQLGIGFALGTAETDSDATAVGAGDIKALNLLYV